MPDPRRNRPGVFGTSLTPLSMPIMEGIRSASRRAEPSFVARPTSKDLLICAKDLVVEAIMVLEKPSSLLIEHDGFIHFDERPLDHRLRQSVPLQYPIERNQHFELCERCLPKVLV